MQIGFVTDEISPDVAKAVEIGASWGIQLYELRMIGENRIPDISATEAEAISGLIRKYGIRITAVSPGTFKETLQDEESLQKELHEILPASFQLAKQFGAGVVIVFGFQRAENEPPENEQRVVEIFRQVADAAQKQGLVIAVENEPGFWCDSGANTARIMAEVNSPALRVNWDPANAIGTNERPYPEGYQALKPWIANVHVKDTVRGALLQCVPVGEGKVDWPGQLQALAKDGIVSHVTIETHCLPLIEKSRQNLATVRRLLGIE